MRQKVFVNSDGTASFACPECRKVKSADVSAYMGRESEVRLKVKCTCGHTYPVFLERRRHVRWKLNLKGTLFQGLREMPVTIKDISRFGMKIQTGTRTSLVPDDRVGVEFILDDINSSVVKREVLIRSVDDFFIGVSFVSDEHYDKLGTYLLYSAG